MNAVINTDISTNHEVVLQEPSIHQLALFAVEPSIEVDSSYVDKLVALLSDDLDFHSSDTGYATHDFH